MDLARVREHLWPADGPRLKASFLLWTTPFVYVGTFLWAVGCGLAYDRLVGFGPLQTRGADELGGFDLVMYLSYALVIGLLVGRRAPRPAGLHALVIAAAYVAFFFGRTGLARPILPLAIVALCTAAALLAAALRREADPPTGG